MEIRAALGDKKHRKVKTLPRRGYLFDLSVSDTEPGFKSAIVRSSFISGRKPGIALVTAGFALVLFLGFLVWRPGLASEKLPALGLLISYRTVPDCVEQILGALADLNAGFKPIRVFHHAGEILEHQCRAGLVRGNDDVFRISPA